MPEANQDTLIVRKINPGFGISSRHSRARTHELATCYAVGGFTNDDKERSLFMTHQPDFDHSNHILILAEQLGLRERRGEMVVFAANPEPLGKYFVRVNQEEKGYLYEDALDIFLRRLRGQLPGFNISPLYYGDQKQGPHSHAEINLPTMTASTNSSFMRLDN